MKRNGVHDNISFYLDYLTLLITFSYLFHFTYSIIILHKIAINDKNYNFAKQSNCIYLFKSYRLFIIWLVDNQRQVGVTSGYPNLHDAMRDHTVFWLVVNQRKRI